MKKSLISIISLILAAVLLGGCGCSDGRSDGSRGEDMPVRTPSISPMPSPDTDNGIVNDGDGYIDDSREGKGSASEKKSDLQEDMLLEPMPSPDTER